MMIAGITRSDLLLAYIEKYHIGDNVLVVHLNDTEGCKKILSDLSDKLDLSVPSRFEMDSDYIFISFYKQDLVKFLRDHSRLVYNTRLDLYVGGVFYGVN